MEEPFFNLRICRCEDGKSMPANEIPDAQVEAVIRDARTYLAVAAANAKHPTDDGTEAEGAPSAEGLAAFLAAKWPGATAEEAAEHFWYLDPDGNRIFVCVEHGVTVTQQAQPVGAPKPVDPPVVIGLQLLMPRA